MIHTYSERGRIDLQHPEVWWPNSNCKWGFWSQMWFLAFELRVLPPFTVLKSRGWLYLKNLCSYKKMTFLRLVQTITEATFLQKKSEVVFRPNNIVTLYNFSNFSQNIAPKRNNSNLKFSMLLLPKAANSAHLNFLCWFSQNGLLTLMWFFKTTALHN